MSLIRLAGAALFAFILSVSTSSAATIGFEGDLPVNFRSGTYVESGVVITHVSGTTFGRGTPNFGNPGNGLFVGLGVAPVIGDTLSVALATPGLFTFDSVDFRSTNGDVTDTVNFIGLVGGIETQLQTVGPARSMTYATLSSTFSAPIDELRIVVSAIGNSSLVLDNLALSPVSAIPLPASAVLLIAGLGGLALFRRRANQPTAPGPVRPPRHGNA